MWMSRARRQDQGNTERATDHLILHPRAASNRRYQGHLLGREPFDHP
jgi:hypothetical protein